MTSAERKFAPALGALMFAAFVESMGSFLVLALLPFYGERFGAGPTLVGWLVATFALAQLLSAPLWGRLSDTFGRKAILLFGLALAALAYLLFAWADSLFALFASRALQGLAAGTVSVVFAYLADVLPADRRAEGIGWVTAATSGAAMVGPVLGSFAAGFDPAYPGYWSFGLAVLALVLVAVLLQPSTPSADEVVAPEGSLENAAVAPSSLFGALTEVVRQPFRPGPLLIWTYAVGMLATSATFGVVALFLNRRFGIDQGSIWWFFSLLAGASLVIRVWLLGPLVRRFGERRLMVAGALLLGVATIGLVVPASIPWLAVPILLFATGQSLLYPCTTALLSRVTDQGGRGLQGQAMGVQQAYGGISRVVGPVAGGFVFARVNPAAPFLVCGVLVLLWASLLAVRAKQHEL